MCRSFVSAAFLHPQNLTSNARVHFFSCIFPTPALIISLSCSTWYLSGSYSLLHLLGIYKTRDLSGSWTLLCPPGLPITWVSLLVSDLLHPCGHLSTKDTNPHSFPKSLSQSTSSAVVSYTFLFFYCICVTLDFPALSTYYKSYTSVPGHSSCPTGSLSCRKGHLSSVISDISDKSLILLADYSGLKFLSPLHLPSLLLLFSASSWIFLSSP